MIAPIGKVQGEGNCGRVTDRGEEACECVRKCRPDFAAGRILTSAARLRTETSYKAGSGMRKTTRARQESAEVVVLRIARQRSQEGPNDEEGGAIDHSVRANPSSLEETGSLSRPGLTTPAPIKKPALSLISELLTGAQVDESNTELAYRTQLWIATSLLRRTAVCGPACTVVCGADGATRPATRFRPGCSMTDSHT